MNTATAFSQAVAATLASAVRESGMTQREVSESAGIPLVSLNRKLAGHRPLTMPELAAVCSVVGLSVLDVTVKASVIAEGQHAAA